jgi:hypothetical protein
VSVIINEFEIVLDDEQNRQPTEPGQAPGQEQEAPAPSLGAADVRDIMRYQMARSKRIWAH